MKYDAKRDLPIFVRESKTMSPALLVDIILARRNEKVSPDSVRKWFDRHPEIVKGLEQELGGMIPTDKQVIDISVFQNGNFRQVSTVNQWIDFLRGVRRIKEKSIYELVSCLKQCCAGQTSTVDFVTAGKWTYKHPDRLTYQDAITILSLLRAENIDINRYAKALKSFLVFKGISEGSRIMVGKPRGFGTYAKLFVARDKLDRMLFWTKEVYGLEAYTIDMLMFKKALRINAVMTATIEDLKTVVSEVDGEITGEMSVFEKGLARKYGEKGKPITKSLDAVLMSLVRGVIGERSHGPIFALTAEKMAAINNEAIEKFAPEVLERFEHVHSNHFWRHMFAQHMLIKTKFNYSIVAYLGNWTPQALQESYGQATPEQIDEWSKDYKL